MAMFLTTTKCGILLMVFLLTFRTTVGKSCTAGYYENPDTGICWTIVSIEQTWFQAKTSCEERGGKLGTPFGVSDKIFIRNRWGNFNLWLGVNDLDTLGVHTDIDGNSIAWTDWGNSNQLALNSERCVLMRKIDNGRWHDYPCSTTAPSICMSGPAIYEWCASGEAVYREEITTHEKVVPPKLFGSVFKHVTMYIFCQKWNQL